MNDRQYWLSVLERLSLPILQAFADRRFKATFPVETLPGHAEHRGQVTHLEALARLLTGIAPWLESTPTDAAEAALHSKLRKLAHAALESGTDPQSPDRLNFTVDSQPLVDAAFLAHAIVRAPQALYASLPSEVRKRLIADLLITRKIKPFFNNWLLFSAMVEACLATVDEPWDAMRVDFAIRQHEQWYKGDGAYGDGPLFHWDYYNSFVIQPMLTDVLDCASARNDSWKELLQRMHHRSARYALVLERMVAPDGSFPAIGRSICYRGGAFHHLAHVALAKRLPERLAPAQARCALTAVIKRTMEAPGTFDDAGFLRLGLAGHQVDLAEAYISTGSLYLCSTALLPLGLPATDPFWSAPAMPFTAQRVWAGQHALRDGAIGD